MLSPNDNQWYKNFYRTSRLLNSVTHFEYLIILIITSYFAHTQLHIS